MTDVRSVAAGAVVENVIQGKLHEFLEGPSAVRFYINGSAVGMKASCLVGSGSVVQDQEVSSANRMPIVPDDLLAESGGLKGERITVSLRNTTAGAITVFTRVDQVRVG